MRVFSGVVSAGMGDAPILKLNFNRTILTLILLHRLNHVHRCWILSLCLSWFKQRNVTVTSILICLSVVILRVSHFHIHALIFLFDWNMGDISFVVGVVLNISINS